MLPAIEIRRAKAGELDAITELLVEVYVGGGYVPPERESVLRDTGRWNEGEVYVAVQEAALAGTLTLYWPGSDEAEMAGAEEAEARLLGVASWARRQGVGRALMETGLRRARETGCRRLLLSTQPSMQAAQQLYQGLGFKRCPERDWKKRGSPRLAYSRELFDQSSV